jgi:RHS repeat-associated protein
MELTTATGEVKGTRSYGAYGQLEEPSGETPAFGYAGMLAHAESGFYFTHYRVYDPQMGRWLSRDPIGEDGGINTYRYVEGNPVSYVDPTGEIAFVPILIGMGVGYAFDYALEQYKKAHCTCQDTPAGAAGNAAAGGAVGGTGPFVSKPRGGIAGGGPSGTATSSFSQMNHAAASRGWYSVATRNGITKVLRKVPYAGAALAGYELYDALSCD